MPQGPGVAALGGPPVLALASASWWTGWAMILSAQRWSTCQSTAATRASTRSRTHSASSSSRSWIAEPIPRPARPGGTDRARNGHADAPRLR